MGQEMMALRRSRTESRETTWRVTVVGGGGGGGGGGTLDASHLSMILSHSHSAQTVDYF